MGLWDSIKIAALKAKCTVGIHGGNFRPIEGETCKYSKICPDCPRLAKLRGTNLEERNISSNTSA